MKIAIILFSSVLAAASSSVISLVPIAYVLNPVPSYNRIDNTLTGEYAYNYAGGPSSKEEIKTADGVTRGAYNYVDAFGIVQSAQYIADKDGFRIIATDIPSDSNTGSNVPLLESEEVQAAKAAHFAEHAKAIAALDDGKRKKRSLDSGLLFSAVSTQYHNEEKETLRSVEEGAISEPHDQYFLAAHPVHASYVNKPSSVSHQSRFQTHESTRYEEVPAAPGHLNYYELAPVSVAPIPAAGFVEIAREIPSHRVISYHEIPASVASVPTAVSSQSRYQIHQEGKKIEVETPVYDSLAISAAPAAAAAVPVPARNDQEADSVIVEAFRAAAPVAPVAVVAFSTGNTAPVAVSSQSRTQVHNEGARIEFNKSPLAQVIDSHGHPVVAVSAATAAAAANAGEKNLLLPHQVLPSPSSSSSSSSIVYGSSHLVSQLPIDTPEVAAAKLDHAKAYAAELAKHQGW